MNILVIAPHPDDESIGCGGTLHKHVRNGDHLVAVFLTSGELGLKHLPKEKAWEIREGEARKAAAILGIHHIHFLRGPDWMLGDAKETISEHLRPLLRSQDWHIIYLPHPGEWHPDHKACLPILRSAWLTTSETRAPAPFPALRAYEIWTPLAEYHHVEDITSVMRVKLRAIRAHQSQNSEFDYARATLGLDAYRGAIAGRYRYAEVFQQINS
jgi:LmbE family N-acetylglucosaminyl deacetylase